MLAEEINKKSYQVTDADDINIEWFAGAKTVGLSAGASTPDNIINNVLDKIKTISENHEEMIYG